MGKRLILKKGNIYCAELKSGTTRYFQYLIDDPCQLNSETIRVFNFKGKKNIPDDLDKVIQSGVEFYAHVVIKWGIQRNFWYKVGYSTIDDNYKYPMFRDVFNLGEDEIIIDRKIQFKKTNKWQIWQAGQPFSSRRNIGWLTEKYKKIDLGIVFSPENIIKKMETGSYVTLPPSTSCNFLRKALYLSIVGRTAVSDFEATVR